MVELTEKEEKARSMICLPLDGLESIYDFRSRVDELSPVVGMFKIGKESYTRWGSKTIDIVRAREAEVFLDLKYHDIPSTVKGAANAAASLGIYMFNVHASGGLEMMEAAVTGARKEIEAHGGRILKILGVTVLTSLDKQKLNEEIRVPGDVSDQVLHLARLSHEAGLDGIVCSAADLKEVKDKLPEGFMYVTPGIKASDGIVGSDQKRVFTAAKAVQDGSSILVVGRAITGHDTSEKRIQAGYRMIQEMAEYL